MCFHSNLTVFLLLAQLKSCGNTLISSQLETIQTKNMANWVFPMFEEYATSVSFLEICLWKHQTLYTNRRSGFFKFVRLPFLKALLFPNNIVHKSWYYNFRLFCWWLVCRETSQRLLGPSLLYCSMTPKTRGDKNPLIIFSWEKLR